MLGNTGMVAKATKFLYLYIYIVSIFIVSVFIYLYSFYISIFIYLYIYIYMSLPSFNLIGQQTTGLLQGPCFLTC